LHGLALRATLVEAVNQVQDNWLVGHD